MALTSTALLKPALRAPRARLGVMFTNAGGSQMHHQIVGWAFTRRDYHAGRARWRSLEPPLGALLGSFALSTALHGHSSPDRQEPSRAVTGFQVRHRPGARTPMASGSAQARRRQRAAPCVGFAIDLERSRRAARPQPRRHRAGSHRSRRDGQRHADVGDAIYGARHVGLKAASAGGSRADGEPAVRFRDPERVSAAQQLQTCESTWVLGAAWKHEPGAHVIRGARGGLRLARASWKTPSCGAQGTASAPLHGADLGQPGAPVRITASRGCLRAALPLTRQSGHPSGRFAEEITPVEVKQDGARPP